MFIEPLPDKIEAGGVSFEAMTKGSGHPLLFLHAGHGVDAADPLVERLSADYRVTVASHPGFGTSTRPAGITTVDDLSYAYIDLVDALGMEDAILVGASFGGWIAAEIAIKCARRFSELILVDPIGAKFSDRESRDVVDIFGRMPEELPELLFADPDAGRAAFANFDFVNLPEEVSLRVARNREALVQYGWAPTLYDPKLKQRLRRIDIPTLVLRGAEDRFTRADYSRDFAAAIPGAKYEQIPNAGHYGYYEQPDDYASHVLAFLGQSRALRGNAA
jgi:pimeloyl-ACP methyl ester carboxylesterase